MSGAGTVHIVHCVDAEGPLYEPIEATFARIKSVYNIELEANKKNLKKLQNKELRLGGKEEAVRQLVKPELLTYMDSWDKLTTMLDEVQSERFRGESLDSFGGGWVFNWFCLNHVGFNENPRYRSMGYHSIFDFYAKRLAQEDGNNDSLQFHFHPHSFQKKAHHCATHWWANTQTLYKILSRGVIERNWFPAANRPGFHVTRPDSHWFLEQFIPFDFANQSKRDGETEIQEDLKDGRFGDWRRAPNTWKPYHPDHDDYQKEGSCRRWIARCLNIGTRLRLLEESDVRQAFDEAQKGDGVVLSVTNHDFRDMKPDIVGVRSMLENVKKDYPNVRMKYSEAVQAMREALSLPSVAACDFKLRLAMEGERTVLHIYSEKPTFGVQPYLAIKTKSGEYYHDNFDIHAPFHRWSYTFDNQTFHISAVDSVGVASNNSAGVTTVSVFDPSSGRSSTVFLNQ